jgi:hypothetical protein
MNSAVVVVKFHPTGRVDEGVIRELCRPNRQFDNFKAVNDDDRRVSFSEQQARMFLGGPGACHTKALSIAQLVESCRRDDLSKERNNVCFVVHEGEVTFLQLIFVSHSVEGHVWLVGDQRAIGDSWFPFNSRLVYKAPKILTRTTQQQDWDTAVSVPKPARRKK